MQKEIKKHTWARDVSRLEPSPPPAAAALHWPMLVFGGLRWGCVGLSCICRHWPGLVVEMAVVLAVTWQDIVVNTRYGYGRIEPAVVSLCWLTLAVVGQRWRSWAFVGLLGVV